MTVRDDAASANVGNDNNRVSFFRSFESADTSVERQLVSPLSSRRRGLNASSLSHTAASTSNNNKNNNHAQNKNRNRLFNFIGSNSSTLPSPCNAAAAAVVSDGRISQSEANGPSNRNTSVTNNRQQQDAIQRPLRGHQQPGESGGIEPQYVSVVKSDGGFRPHLKAPRRHQTHPLSSQSTTTSTTAPSPSMSLSSQLASTQTAPPDSSMVSSIPSAEPHKSSTAAVAVAPTSGALPSIHSQPTTSSWSPALDDSNQATNAFFQRSQTPLRGNRNSSNPAASDENSNKTTRSATGDGGAVRSDVRASTTAASTTGATATAGTNATNGISSSRAGNRTADALSDFIPVEGDMIEGTDVPTLTHVLTKLKKAVQQTGLMGTRSSLSRGLVSSTAMNYNLNGGGSSPSKNPSSNGLSGVAQWAAATSSSTGVAHVVLFTAMALGLVYGVYANRYKITDVDLLVDWSLELNVAFVGNAYLFVNDIPRVMEAISDNHIRQQSVIHATAGSLAKMLLTGSGMFKQWRTEEAFLLNYTNSYGNNETIYDYGLCTVAQILLGYDQILTYGNIGGAYFNDYKNPCIMDYSYKEYVDMLLYNDNQTYANWDYIVLVDQTKRMAFEDARQETIYSLANAYGPLLNASGAIPVIVDTHSFWSEDTNMTGLESVEHFQSLIYDGVEEYVNALASVLPSWQYPVVAPIGIAYLTIYEERRSLWEKLFITDNMHSSVHGSYLFACVLYATMYGHLPDRTRTVSKVEYLFADSRKLVGKLDYPTENEAYYYRNVARRVALRGYIPSSLRNPEF